MKVVLILCLLIPCRVLSQTIPLTSGWKFSTGDNPKWSEPDFNDSEWRNISVGQAWELQGFKGYDGYAWYRLKIIIPSSLRDSSVLRDLLKFNFAIVDNCDQFFLNGVLIGQNAKAVTGRVNEADFTGDPIEWNIPRIYILPTRDPRIFWDRENTIAIRVFDKGGNGGMALGTPALSVPNIQDYLKLNTRDFSFRIVNGFARKMVRLMNSSATNAFSGKLRIKCTDNYNRVIKLDTVFDVTVNPGSFTGVPVSVPFIRDEILSIAYTFTEDRSMRRFRENEYVPYRLTPDLSPAPRLHIPAVIGVHPSNPVAIRVAVTGNEPVVFSITGLPPGLTFDSKRRVIEGILSQSGSYPVGISVASSWGKDEKKILIKAGDELALTPPMGWNSYYSFWNDVTEKMVRRTASLMNKSGLSAHGYTYCNIDDGWAGPRDAAGKIVPNNKFSDIKGLGQFIHHQGLKFGIYSSPGPRTCGGFPGSLGHEAIDAATYAAWGVDYLKYDWCSYDDVGDVRNLTDLQKPYRLMRRCLDSVHRDIIFSFCQYGMGEVWKWGRSLGGNLWRTTFDITDSWQSLKQIAFHPPDYGIYRGGPGGWNDPDMIQAGWLRGGRELHPSNLTVPEQYTQFTLWALWSAPLLLSCDLDRFDDLARSILTNDEVIAVDQDPAGRPALGIVADHGFQVYTRQLADSTLAVGIFNLNDNDILYDFVFSVIGAPRFLEFRDLWRQKDLGARDSHLKIFLPAHGAALFKVRPSAKEYVRSYHEDWVRYLMADILLSHRSEFYRSLDEDANSREALRRLDAGVTIDNLGLFERKREAGSYRIMLKDGGSLISGSEVRLSSDGVIPEADVREAMRTMERGGDLDRLKQIQPAAVREAMVRDSAGVRLTNPGEENIGKLRLTSDVGYDEDRVRYMLTDMQLGGDPEFYANIYRNHRDPNAGEAMRRRAMGVRIVNLEKFERTDLPGAGIKIVFKGTRTIVTGDEVQLADR